jgi:hypothetical protein
LLDTRDVEYWRQSNLPVIIVLVHLGRKEAYWKLVDAGIGPGTRRSFRQNERSFDASARDAIADLCVSKAAWGVWFPPLQGGEPGHINMVEVILPRRHLRRRIATFADEASAASVWATRRRFDGMWNAVRKCRGHTFRDGCTLPRPRHVTDLGGFVGVPWLG